MKTFICFALLLLVFSSGCKKDDITEPSNQQSTVKDIDGNVYHTVTIGKQVWMVENLKVTKYRNGDPIPNITDASEWSQTKTGAYCNYDNSQGVPIYGRLYNGYVFEDLRGIAPLGWHIPSRDDWLTLIQTLGIKSLVGGNLKEAGTSNWKSPNEGADNSSGFTALPGGTRTTDGDFRGIGEGGYWWSTSPVEYCDCYKDLSLSYSSKAVNFDETYFLFESGLSVRCLKD